MVLQNRDKLKLTAEQVDSIVESAQKIRQLTKSGVITKEKNNRWEYERLFILQHLNEEQVGDFLNIRNFDYAKSYAEKMWKEMEDNDIAFEYDSTATVQQIIAYQLNKSKIEYVYKDNSAKMKEMSDYLYRSAYPKALRELRVAKRKNPDQDTRDKDEFIF